MKIVAGLGNPGPKYDRTRHNVGYRVIDELSQRLGAGKPRRRFDATLAEGNLGGEKVLLTCPQTYMNESGRAVRQLVDFFGLQLNDLLIVCDDFNLELARLRMRTGGSAGGQKGLADIIRKLATEEFPRLRIGIGRPPEQMNAADFVLSKFKRSEQNTIDDAVVRAAEGVELWIRSGIGPAMNRVNAASSGQDDD
ncbi:MAG TPA: aminoacyl-tRNA hydrolase [Planctomycetaceae bacterium]|jgi:PTH1 family peptidyl-tRNA hydrolase|nr:aminoacyl-tRNA hydrolase [Planctomycetaceae bacterium]